MAKTSGGQARAEQKQSARQSDMTKPGRTEKVSSIEKVGGKHGMRVSVPNHPEHCDVAHGPKGKMDR